MAELSPESKEIYDLLMAETREAYEERFLAHKKQILDSVKSFVHDRNKQFKAVRKSIESVNDALGTEIGDARASIDPDDCDREAYLALVNRKETASGSSPTNSTSSLHHRAPAAAATAPSTASSTAPMSAPSGTTSAPPYALSPEARRFYDYLVGGSAPPASATTDVYTNVLVSTELDVVHDAVEDLAAPTPSTCSTICLAGDTSATTTPSYQTVGPASPESTPTSSTTVSTMLTSPSEIEHIQDAVDFGVAELAAPELSDNALVDPMGETAIVPPCLLAEGYKVFHEVPTATAIVPWPPPSWNPTRTPLIRGQDLCHEAQQKRGKELLVSLDSMGNWNAIWLDVELKPPWPPLGVCMDMPIDVCMINTMVSLATWPMEFSNGIDSGKRNDTNCAIAQPILISSEYFDLAILSVPRMFMDVPFLISADVHQEFMGAYSVTAVLSRLFTLLLVRTEVMLWPFFQFATGNMILLLPWDPGLPLSGMDNKLSTIKHEHVVRLLTAREVNYLQGRLMHSQLSCSLLIDTILKGVVALVQLHSQPSWGLSVWILPLANRAPYTLVNWCYLNYTAGSSDLAIPHWVLVNFDSARVQFQWAPVVRKWISHHIRRGKTQYSQLIEWSLQSELGVCNTGNILFCYCVLVHWEIPWTVILASWKLWLQYCSAGHEYPYACEKFRWIIAWPLYLVFYTCGSKSGKLFHQAEVICEGSLEKRNAAFQPFSTRTVQAFLLVIWSQAHHTGTCVCHCFTSGTASVLPFQFLAYISMWSFHVLEFCQQKLSWDPGITKTVDICTQCCYVSCHLILTAAATELAEKKLLQDRFQLYTINYALLHGQSHIQAAGFAMDRVGPSLPEYLLQSYDTGHICCGGSASIFGDVLAIGIPERRLHDVQSFFDIGLFRTNYKLMARIFEVVNLLSTVQDVQLHLKLIRSSGQGDTFSESFLPLVSIVLLGEELQLSWDPGGQKFIGFFTQPEAKRRNAADPAYNQCHCLDNANYFDKVCADQDHYFDVFHDQAHIGHYYYIRIFLEQVCTVRCLNPVKVGLDYGIHRDLGKVMKHQVPWDPGGSTWHRLEVKPNFKEGGLSTTYLRGLSWAAILGLGPLRSVVLKQQSGIYTNGADTSRLG